MLKKGVIENSMKKSIKKTYLFLKKMDTPSTMHTIIMEI